MQGLIIKFEAGALKSTILLLSVNIKDTFGHYKMNLKKFLMGLHKVYRTVPKEMTLLMHFSFQPL